MILDGEAVALDAAGVPSFGEMQNRARSTRVEYWAFDILISTADRCCAPSIPTAGDYSRRWARAGE